MFLCNRRVIRLSWFFDPRVIPLGIGMEDGGSRNRGLGIEIGADNGRFRGLVRVSRRARRGIIGHPGGREKHACFLE